MSLHDQKVPSCRLHKPSGQAVVTLSGQNFYLGRFGTPESQKAYERKVGEWLARGRTLATTDRKNPLSVNELILAYMRHAETYYRDDAGPTSEVKTQALAFRPLKALYGDTAAAAFGPLALRRVQQALVASTICRHLVNKRVGHIKRLFKWNRDRSNMEQSDALRKSGYPVVTSLEVARVANAMLNATGEVVLLGRIAFLPLSRKARLPRGYYSRLTTLCSRAVDAMNLREELRLASRANPQLAGHVRRVIVPGPGRRVWSHPVRPMAPL